jgi:glycosyltransferase involved in cell wall biosynthesis
MSRNVVFLVRELSGYFVSCIQFWKKNYDGQVWVVYWPTNQDAPFLWKMDSTIHWIEKSDFFKTSNQVSFWQNVQHVFVSGWSDKDYNAVVKGHYKFTRTILFDTQWDPSWKMQLGRFWLLIRIVRHFNSVWVPGKRQRALAKKLFFKSHQIFEHFYVGDQFLFDQPKVNDSSSDTKLNIVFVGRLIHEKGILPLITRFIETLSENPSLNWHLHICGTGPLQNHCPLHDSVTYHGFIQPKELAVIFQKMDLFVLPSLYEPWGVVVHEAAFAGLPLLVSDAVGAADAFVENGINGWVFGQGDLSAIIYGIRRFSQLPPEQRQAMSDHSKMLARSVVLDSWSSTANKIICELSCAE